MKKIDKDASGLNLFNLSVKISREVAQEDQRMYIDLDSLEYIYQYTNGAGLEGIVSNKSIWATNIVFLNDSREVHDGLDHAVEICQQLRNRRTSSTEFVMFLDALLSNLKTYSGASDYFVACFTVNGDQLSQWRGYGDGGNGYSIGFRSSELESKLIQSCKEFNIRYYGLRKVIYNDDSKRVLIESYVNRYFEEFIDSASGDVHELCGVASLYCSFTMFDLISNMKHSSFSEEEEIRAVFVPLDYEIKKVRRRGNLFVPYLSIDSLDQNIPIERIYVGPTAITQLFELGTQLLLKNNGFEEVEIIPSLIPYRN